MRRAIALLLALVKLQCSFATLRVALLSDLHVGENCAPVPYNGTDDCACIANDKRAIAFVNSLDPQPDVVIVTGDITSSSWPSQWTKARQLLDELRAPYYPALGNHDVWPYDREGGNETAGPCGDASFAATFGDILRASPNITHYVNAPVFNPVHNTTSQFQNWVLTLREPATGSLLSFVAGDWNTRDRAIDKNESGVMGWAERGLSDFPGGTLPWLRTALADAAALPAGSRPDRLFLVQHQPISCPWWIPDFAFCFGVADKALLRAALTAHWPEDAWWGVLAGHNHAFLNQSSPFGETWPAFREVETSATKGDALDSDIASAVTVIEFEGAGVSLITRHYFSLSSQQWASSAGQ